MRGNPSQSVTYGHPSYDISACLSLCNIISSITQLMKSDLVFRQVMVESLRENKDGV